MKKKNLLMMAGCALLAGNLSAQTSQAGGELVSLLPEGVQANISTVRNLAKDKNLVVAGSAEKGYYAFFSACFSAPSICEKVNQISDLCHNLID